MSSAPTIGYQTHLGGMGRPFHPNFLGRPFHPNFLGHLGQGPTEIVTDPTGQTSPIGERSGSVMLLAGGIGGTLGAGLYGGLIGGMASADWKGAGTGALAAGGLSAATASIAMFAGRMYGAGFAMAALGATGLFFAIRRWRRRSKGR